MAHQDPAIFPDPETFDPNRFDDPELAKYLIWPHGRHTGPITASSRICPGRDYAVLVAKLFCIGLLRGYDWDLADPNVRWSRDRISLNVASPIGPIDVTRFDRIQGGP